MNASFDGQGSVVNTMGDGSGKGEALGKVTAEAGSTVLPFDVDQDLLVAATAGRANVYGRRLDVSDRSPVAAAIDAVRPNAFTRVMSKVRLEVEGTDAWSIVKTQPEPIRVGDRMPDAILHHGQGRPVCPYELADDSFVAVHFTDVRRRPTLSTAFRPAIWHFSASCRHVLLDSSPRVLPRREGVDKRCHDDLLGTA